MEFENILKLIDSVSASSLDSFVYEQNGTKIKLEKKKQKIRVNGSSALSAEQLLTGAKVGLTTEGSAVRAAGTAAEPDTVSQVPDTQKPGKTITSPLVGVFYTAPSEDAGSSRKSVVMSVILLNLACGFSNDFFIKPLSHLFYCSVLRMYIL